MTLLRGVILVIHATSVINGCSQIDKVPLEGNIKISHLVITGKITKITDGTSYLADVLRVFKDSGKKFDRSILITQIGMHYFICTCNIKKWQKLFPAWNIYYWKWTKVFGRFQYSLYISCKTKISEVNSQPISIIFKSIKT